MKIYSDITDDELKVFIEEAEEHIVRLNENVNKLRENGNNSGLIQDIFRSAHTLKGSSAILGHHRMIQVTHAMESLLDKLKHQNCRIDQGVVDILLEAINSLTVLKDEISCDREECLDIHSIVHKLKTAEDNLSFSRQAGVTLDESHRESSDYPYNNTCSYTHNEKYSGPYQSLTTVSSNDNNDGIQTVRLGVRTLDKITNITGDLVLDCLQINEISKMLEMKYAEDNHTRNLGLISKNISRSMKEIYEDIIRLRMIPIDILFRIFPHMIEDLSKMQGKKIDFSTEGGDTKLDRTILSHIRDPLIHLLRNAVDHGIELPEYRLKTGKSETGKLRLSVREEDECIIITLEDDGRGINPLNIKESAINRGCISQKLANELNSAELIDLIFLPGMSTTSQATEVSGRGIGLDIVRSNIEQLNGMVNINTRVGQGTVFTIQLPPTAAILQGFMVTSDNSTYIIPQLPVIDKLRIRTKEIKCVRGQDFIKINQQKIPVFYINNFNRFTRNGHFNRKDQVHIIIVRVSATVVGIVCDELMTQQEFIISPQRTQLGDVTGIATTTILEDGQMAMIVNIPSFIRTSLLQRIESQKMRC